MSKHILSFLHTFIWRALSLRCSVFFFVLSVSYYYSSPLSLCSKQQITIALFLSSGQPNVCFLFRLSASLPHCPHLLIVFASVCPLLFMGGKTAGVQRSSLEVCFACSQAAQSLPRLWQDAFCHLCHATTPVQYLACPSNLINTYFEDEEMSVVALMVTSGNVPSFISVIHVEILANTYLCNDLIQWNMLRCYVNSLSCSPSGKVHIGTTSFLLNYLPAV